MSSPNADLRHLDEPTRDRLSELEWKIQPAAILPVVSLRRTGLRPLAFPGTTIVMVSGINPDLPFWYELNIHRTDTGSFVSDIRLFGKAANSSDVFRVAEHDTLAAVFNLFEAYDPSADLAVVPDLPSTASHAALALYSACLRMRINQITDHYRALLGDFLAKLETAAA